MDPLRDVIAPLRRQQVVAGILAALLTVGLVIGLAPPATGAAVASSWVRTFGTAGNDQGWGVDIGPAGEVYVAGFVQAQGLDVYLARVDASGTTA